MLVDSWIMRSWPRGKQVIWPVPFFLETASSRETSQQKTGWFAKLSCMVITQIRNFEPLIWELLLPDIDGCRFPMLSHHCCTKQIAQQMVGICTDHFCWKTKHDAQILKPHVVPVWSRIGPKRHYINLSEDDRWSSLMDGVMPFPEKFFGLDSGTHLFQIGNFFWASARSFFWKEPIQPDWQMIDWEGYRSWGQPA